MKKFKICEACGKTFEYYTSSYPTRRFCSRKCQNSSQYMKQCISRSHLGLKIPYKPRPSMKGRIPWNIGIITERTCLQCGKLFSCLSSINCKFCSFKCYNEYRSPTNRKYPLEFSFELKEEIRNKYGRRCVMCGINESFPRLDVHHKDSNKFNLSENNLIPLCKSCHTSLQNKGGPDGRVR